jgi:hypothetical protein
MSEPLQRFQASASSCLPVAGVQLPFMELATLQSLVGTSVPRLLGYLDPTLAASFPTDRCGLPLPPSPCNFRNRVHPLVSFALLQSTVAQSPARVRSRVAAVSPQAPPVGSRPSSRPQLAESTSRWVSRPTYVPSSAFRTLSTGCSSSSLAHLFRCAAVSRVLAPGVSSPDLAVPPRRWPLPSRRWRCRLPVARRQRTSRRPQGLAPSRGPQCPAGCLVPLVTRVPSCVFSFLGLLSSDLGRTVVCPPLTTFTLRCCVCPASLVPSVSRSLARASVPRDTPRSSFVAFESVALLG